MKWPFRRKKNYVRLSYQFLCKTCDIFFYKDNCNQTRCPICGRPAEVYSVKEVNDERK